MGSPSSFASLYLLRDSNVLSRGILALSLLIEFVMHIFVALRIRRNRFGNVTRAVETLRSYSVQSVVIIRQVSKIQISRLSVKIMLGLKH